jgi:hypothetical protein
MQSRWSMVALLLVLSGCGPESVSPDGASGGDAPGDRLAMMVAEAMEVPEFRGEMLRVLRESPYAEHAIPLGTLVGGPDAAWFVGGLARAGKTDPHGVRALVASLPPLDLYVPRRTDRERWDGGLPLIVAARVDAELPRVGFDPEGGPVPIDLTGSEVTPPLFLLQFAEHKAYRIEPSAPRSSGAIQPPSESDQAMAFIRRDASGREVLAQVRDLPTGPEGAKYCPPENPGCPPEEPGGGSGDPEGPPGPTIGGGTTRLVELKTYGECDNTFCGEGNEFEFRAYATGHTNVLRIEGVPSTAWYTYTTTIKTVASFSPIPSNSIAVHVWETDVFSDDHFVFLNGAMVSNPHLRTDPTSTNGTLWTLWRSPYINPATEDPKVQVRFTWTN